jgi:hypothetical protein
MLKKVNLLNASTTVSSSHLYRIIETSLSMLFLIHIETLISFAFIVVNNSARVGNNIIYLNSSRLCSPLPVKPHGLHFDSSMSEHIVKEELVDGNL